MIPGSGHDKVSDITINIIRRRLVWFTELQCRIHKIPSINSSAKSVEEMSTVILQSRHTLPAA